jgi:hypothetical protein
MKIGIDKTPNIMQIVFRAEQSDKFYSNCMWGVVNLDSKNGIMSACTECGIYAYKWNGKRKDFLKLMKTADEDCLLAKISTKEFDLDIDDFVVHDYPSRARIFANLFVEYVQPRIEI